MGGGLLAAVAGLQISVPLVPSESVLQGPGALFAQVWLLMLVLGLVLLLARRQPLRRSWIDGLTVLLAGWLLVSAVAQAWDGNPRATWNATWQWVALLASFWLVRQSIRTSASQRALCAVMIGLAALLAVHGVYQYAIGLPLQRRQYQQASEQQKQAILQSNGLDPSARSPQRHNFENRLLGSTEPFATFGLANSLAGVLAPWFVLAAGVFGVPACRRALSGGRLGALAVLLAVILVCLVLTKSRAAWLAVLVSGLAMGVGPLRSDLQRWRRAAGWGLAALILAAAAGVLSGALDRQVFTEAGLSVAYRLQYWQAAMAMTLQHPVFGSGPGNFQDYYTRYKLPWASETVADPHNLVFEAAANAGLLAGLLLLAIVMLVTLRLLRVGSVVGRRGAEIPFEEAGGGEPTAGVESEPTESERKAVWWIYAGAVLGSLAASGFAWSAGFPPEMVAGIDLPVTWILGLPVLAATLLVLDRWVQRGNLPTGLLFGAWLASVLNLLAAGGISYPGVGQSFWLIAALGLNRLDLSGRSPAEDLVAPRPATLTVPAGGWPWMAAIAVAIGLAFGCWLSSVRPMREADPWLGLAGRARNYDDAQQLYSLAAASDPWDPQPWQWLAEIYQLHWFEEQSPALRERFDEAITEAGRRDARSYSFAMREAWLELRWYRATGQRERLQRAIEGYRRAVSLYPNSNFAHAQLAWTLALAGQTDAASQQAERALELDRRNPHIEQKLAQRELEDPARDLPVAAAGPPAPAGRAEQVMQQLRKAKDEK